MLVASCKPREPECFKLASASARGWTKTFDNLDELGTFEAFVISDPPKGAEALLQAVVKLCDGGLRAPDAPVSNLQWWVYRETREMPRTLVVVRDKHDPLSLHRDLQILEVTVRWNGCEASADYSYYPDGYEDTDSARYPTHQRFQPPPRCAGQGR